MNMNERKFCETVDKWEVIIGAERDDWDKLYHYLFASETGRPVAKRLLSLVPFDWYDPDTSYEEDVRAFVKAAMEKRDEIKTNNNGLKDAIREVISDKQDILWGGWMDVERLSQAIAEKILEKQIMEAE